MDPTDIFYLNAEAVQQGYRRIINKGGTSSSKTFSVEELLFCIADKRGLNSQGNCVISVVAETLPHLKKGAIKDFETILKLEGRYDESQINFTDHRYYFGTSYVEFFSVDTIGKALGSRRDILFVNECNNMPYKIVQELEARTAEIIFYDFNPTEVFWIEDKIMVMPDKERKLITSNYKSNKHLQESIKREIELKASLDPNFKRIHIDCEYGVYEGLIFPKIILVDEMPAVSRQLGLDFGFTNDPSALMDIRFANGMLWIDELLFQTAMTNNDLIKFLKAIGVQRHEQIIADSAEPKSIKEIADAGFNIVGAEKGPDSIRIGIDRMKTYPICVTKRSHNTIREFRSYHWAVDKNGDIAKDNNGQAYPFDMNNHSIDPTRYVVLGITKAPTQTRITFNRRG